MRNTILLIGLALAAPGCGEPGQASEAHASVPGRMGQGALVRFHYTLTVDGKKMETSSGREPVSAVVGSGDLIFGLEEALGGMKPGEKRRVVIPPEKGYGLRHAEGVQKVPRAAFRGLAGLKPGVIVGGMANGRPFRAIVKDVNEREVVLDLNHPLAGKTLLFDLELVSIEPARF
jgi:FKBP-type peptidyl-prolyl cis-trans isomerase SlyD